MANFSDLSNQNTIKDEAIEKEISQQKNSFKMRLEMKKLNKGSSPGGSPQQNFKRKGLEEAEVNFIPLVIV